MTRRLLGLLACLIPLVLAQQFASSLVLSPDWKISDVSHTRYYDFVVSKTKGAPDGFRRPMLLVNGVFPGPTIEANAYDHIVIRVQNTMDSTTTLHWHGLHQRSTPFEDGPAGITQCPIPAHGEYTYRFSPEGQYGTFWWHAHSAAQYIDGLTGPLIIHSTEDPLKRGVQYDYDQLVLLQDWYHTESGVIIDGLVSPGGFNGTVAAPSPQSLLINGIDRYDCSFASEGSTCGESPALAEILVPAGQRTRLRFVNEGAHADFLVDEHPLRIIESDDTPVNGSMVHRLPLTVGQRYSAILDTTAGQIGDAYYLRSSIQRPCLATQPADLGYTALAIVRYVDPVTLEAPINPALPISKDWSDPIDTGCADLPDADLVPLIPFPYAPHPDQRVFFDMSGSFSSDGFRWTANGITFRNVVYRPLLHQVHNGTLLNSSDIGAVYIDETAREIDIVARSFALQSRGLVHRNVQINNLGGAAHPFHLHSRGFAIIARGTGKLTAETAETIEYHTLTPPRRDVLVIPARSYAVLRMIADIPGVWALHCHIAFHQAQGFVGAVVVQPSAIQAMEFPQKIQDLCDAKLDDTDPGHVEPGFVRAKRSRASQKHRL